MTEKVSKSREWDAFKAKLAQALVINPINEGK